MADTTSGGGVRVVINGIPQTVPPAYAATLNQQSSMSNPTPAATVQPTQTTSFNPTNPFNITSQFPVSSQPTPQPTMSIAPAPTTPTDISNAVTQAQSAASSVPVKSPVVSSNYDPLTGTTQQKMFTPQMGVTTHAQSYGFPSQVVGGSMTTATSTPTKSVLPNIDVNKEMNDSLAAEAIYGGASGGLAALTSPLTIPLGIAGLAANAEKFGLGIIPAEVGSTISNFETEAVTKPLFTVASIAGAVVLGAAVFPSLPSPFKWTTDTSASTVDALGNSVLTPKGTSILQGTEEVGSTTSQSLTLLGKIPTGITKISEFTGDVSYQGMGSGIIPSAVQGFGITQTATKFLGMTFKTGWEAPYVEGVGFSWSGGGTAALLSSSISVPGHVVSGIGFPSETLAGNKELNLPEQTFTGVESGGPLSVGAGKISFISPSTGGKDIFGVSSVQTFSGQNIGFGFSASKITPTLISETVAGEKNILSSSKVTSSEGRAGTVSTLNFGSKELKPFGDEGGPYQIVNREFSLQGSTFNIKGSQFKSFVANPSKSLGESLATGEPSGSLSGSAKITSLEPTLTSMSGGGRGSFSFVKPLNDLGGLLGGGGTASFETQKFGSGQPEGWAQTVKASTTSLFASPKATKSQSYEEPSIVYPRGASNAITTTQQGLSIGKSQSLTQGLGLGQKQGIGFNFQQGIGQPQSQGTSQSLGQSLGQSQGLGQGLGQSLVQSQQTITPTVPITITPAPPILIPPSMFNPGNQSFFGGRSMFKLPKRKYKYTPSLVGEFTGFTVSKVPGFTIGGEIRGLLRPRKSRRRKR